MREEADPIRTVRIAAPCTVAWESMQGDARVRHCTLCDLNVYNFAEMTREEVRQLLLRTEGRICGRMVRRTDGTLITRDCPSALRAMRRRLSRAASAVMAALMGVASLASASTTGAAPSPGKVQSNVKIDVEQLAAVQPAVFSGVVTDPSGNPVPGVTVTLLDEVSPRVITAVTNEKGKFALPAVDDGVYRLQVSLEGFETAIVQHLALRQCEATHARVALRFDPNAVTMTVGIIVVDPAPVRIDPMSTTFTQDFINKLPR